jgi:hypothetical protein
MHNIFETLCSDLSKSPNHGFGMISAYLQANGDAFDRTGFVAFSKKTLKNDGLVDFLESQGAASDVLPIEFFKDEPLLNNFLKPSTVPVRTFFSSGTTGQAQSRSPFSESGLENYRVESLLGFFAALKAKFAHLSNNEIIKIQGISLIPSSADWPNSSLAQMVSWISEHFPVKFVGEGQNALKGIDFSKPVWMFGTAFHFVNLIDDGCKQKLAENSLIVETGGTKGRSRSVSRSELFSLIAKAFALPETRIISEYGMSELAAQAYDLDENTLTNRWYRFPAWVNVQVLTDNGTLRKEGVGAIVIFDPFRTDLPYPVRSEDIVELKDNRFQILRRSRSAPLKGCSLLVELPQRKAIFNLAAHETSSFKQEGFETTHWAKEALQVCERLLKDTDVLVGFTEEFGHKDLALYAVQDLSRSLKLSSEELASAAKMSLGPEKNSAWTIIAPNSHSLAAVQPIIMGFVAGLDLAVRVPERFTDKRHFLTRLISGLNSLRPNSIVVLPASFHIEFDNDIYKQGNILAFGTNQTLRKLQSIAPGRVSGFGETLAIACGDVTDVKKFAQDIARDFFSLRQAGCMSPRVFILQEHAEDDLERATEALIDAAKIYKSHLAVDDITALNGERIRLKLNSSGVVDGKSEVNMPLVIGLKTKVPFSLGAVIAQKAYAIPVISVKTLDWSDFIKSLKTEFLPDLPVSLILLADNAKNQVFLKDSSETPMSTLAFRVFGQSQSPMFSGMHEGRPLFSTNQ